MSSTLQSGGEIPFHVSELEPPHALPRRARSAAARFVPDVPSWVASYLNVIVPGEIERAVSKRRSEYVAGRWCALRAVRGLMPQFEGQIDSWGGAPRWPAGIVGSITHTSGFACAAALSSHDAVGIGIDSEEVGDAERIAAIRELACTSGEQRPAATLPEPVHYTLIFSAKESLFKCLFPALGRMFWYEDARVTLGLDRGTFRATLLVDLSAELRRGSVFDGTYRVAGRLVHTALVRLRGAQA